MLDMQLHGRIVKIRRDDMVISSARIIFATLESTDGETLLIDWVDLPDSMIGLIPKVNGMDFDDAWEKGKVGDEVVFIKGVNGFRLEK